MSTLLYTPHLCILCPIFCPSFVLSLGLGRGHYAFSDVIKSCDACWPACISASSSKTRPITKPTSYQFSSVQFTSGTSLSSASKPDWFCYPVGLRYFFLNCISWTFRSSICNLTTFCCANQIKDACNSEYIKYLSCICGDGRGIIGLQSFCWIYCLWFYICELNPKWVEPRLKFDRWSEGSSELNGDQRLNRFGATQFAAELDSNSDLTRVQSWTTLVQRALNTLSPTTPADATELDSGVASVNWAGQ